MNKSDLRRFIKEEAQIIMAGRIKKDKFSTFKDDFVVHPDNHKRVIWKKNKNIFVNEYSIKYLMDSFKALVNTETKAVSGEVKMDSYDPKKKTIKYNDVKIPSKVVIQLDRVWINHFGEH